MSEHEQMKDTEYSTLWHKLAARFAILSEDDLACWEESIDWRALSQNQNFLWSRSFLSKHASDLDVYALSGNPSLPWDEALFNDFSWHLAEFSKNRGFPWYASFIERNQHVLHWKSLCANEGISWGHSLLQSFSPNIHYWSLSQNRGTFWSFELIDHYKDSLDWLMLSENPTLPWQDRQFVETFHGRLHQQTLYTNAGYRFNFEEIVPTATPETWNALSRNEGLSFSTESLEKYADSWDWSALSGNTAVPWDRELVARYHDQIDWAALAGNPNVQWGVGLIDAVAAKGYLEYLSENPRVWNWLCSLGLSKSRSLNCEMSLFGKKPMRHVPIDPRHTPLRL